LSAEALEEHERAIRASEAAANAPSPLVRSPSSRVLGRGDPAAALPALAIQSELHALDQQIRQSTQELVLLQQQQHLQSLQMQQASIHAQMQQSQSQPPSRANSRPSSALPYAEQLQQQLLHQHSTPSAQLQQQQGNSWYRGPSPSPGTGQGTARSFSPPTHSHRASGGVDNEVLLAAAAGASSRSNVPTPAPPAAAAAATVRTGAPRKGRGQHPPRHPGSAR